MSVPPAHASATAERGRDTRNTVVAPAATLQVHVGPWEGSEPQAPAGVTDSRTVLPCPSVMAMPC